MPRLTHETPRPIEDLEVVLADQERITAAMTAMLSRQRELVQTGDAEALLSLLSDRQTLVDQLIASQERLGESLAAAERTLPGADEDRKTRIESALDAIQARLQEVLESDRADQDVLERSKCSMRAEISKLDANQKAHAAYGRGNDRRNRYADHKG